MRLTVVGCAPAWSLAPGVASSCYLVEQDEGAILLDLGQGAFAELSRYRPPGSVDGVLISHLHPDHMVDIVPLRHYIKYGSAGASPPTVRGPAELRDRFGAFTGEPAFLDDLPGQPLEPGAFELAGFTVEARRVTHIADSFAFRVTVAADGRGLVYSGDCADAGDLLPLIRPGDTLLCEAFYGAEDNAGPLHLTAGQAARAASAGGAGRLVLTHIRDTGDDGVAIAAARQFDGEILLGRPGLRLLID